MLTNARHVFFVLLGVICLLLKGRYSGPWEETVHSYGGNVSASFAVYFVVIPLFARSRYRTLAAAVIALGTVELFEVFDGFGVMTNVYDRFDLIANGVGVLLAAALEVVTSARLLERRVA